MVLATDAPLIPVFWAAYRATWMLTWICGVHLGRAEVSEEPAVQFHHLVPIAGDGVHVVGHRVDGDRWISGVSSHPSCHGTGPGEVELEATGGHDGCESVAKENGSVGEAAKRESVEMVARSLRFVHRVDQLPMALIDEELCAGREDRNQSRAADIGDLRFL